MTELETRLKYLEEQLQRAQDELAIRNLMVRYGLAVDCGDVASAVACHSSDAVYTVSAPRTGRGDDSHATDLRLVGHRAIRDMLESELHQSLLPNCAHTVGPVAVEVGNGEARATGYSRLYRRQGEQFDLLRLAINEWRFSRIDCRWLIVSRESRLVGERRPLNCYNALHTTSLPNNAVALPVVGTSSGQPGIMTWSVRYERGSK
ncbi:MAG: nuclear transport factor 2 family protein [Halioglobus sp.]